MKLSLKAARVNAGYKACEVAKILKVSNSTIVNWEKPGYIARLNLERLKQLTELYGISIDDLDV